MINTESSVSLPLSICRSLSMRYELLVREFGDRDVGM